MRRHLSTAICLALAGFTMAPLGAASAAEARLTTTQLPRGVVPTHYDVAVTPHADKMTFDGQVAITLTVTKSTSSITLNAADLSFSKVSLTPEKLKIAVPEPKVSVDEKAQTATFTFDHPIPAGTYRLAMTYTGKIGTQANGIFALDYDTKAGKKRALYTQFENSDARRFIPSWDEPNYKATFTLTATVPSNEMAVSNMPIASKKDLGNGLTEVHFGQSPKMSTYLLFFGLGDFERATLKAEGGTEIGVITQKGMIDQAKFALDSSKQVLKEYNDYFGVPYPLPKLDNIAAPGQSQFFSAMENWGAIFTFEYSLLLNPQISTQLDKQRAFNVAAHEMAHQWFGDLVTMSWWDDLWLNEGFASWMASRTTQKLHPEWHTDLDAVGVREGAMSQDSVATTHPIVQHVETVEQASQAFDAITYSKGEAVIHMLEGYVGEDAWRTGVRNYIKAHEHGNTVSDDLWKSVQAAAGKPITQIAHDFTLQPGIPLIEVRAAACSNGKTEIALRQGEFTRDRPNKTPLHWHVPVIAKTVAGKEVRMVVDGKATLSVPGCGPVLVNAGQTGYYRTLYAQNNFDALKGQFAKLAPIDQLGLLGDTWALGMAGNEPVSNVLALITATPADADPQVWAEVAGYLSALDNYYRGDQARQQRLRTFALAQLHPVFAKIGWEAKAGESVPTANLRMQLIGVMADLGDQQVIGEARRRFAAQKTDPAALPVALRKTVTAIVAQHADEATWDHLHAQAKAETTPLIKDQLYSMLSIPENDALAQRALELALTGEPGATNSAGMIRAVGYRHPEMAFDFAVAHKDQVDKLVDAQSATRYYPAIGAGSTKPEMIQKIQDYAQKYIAPTSRRVADQVIANIKYRMMIRQDRLPSIDEWLEKHSG
ncbi:MAG TPA: M1 family metallopeptidase [Frateuria sp.]|uniref:M1 family metallopeptidase n=1 Tax=Frateuria sp. TaxID=2211372 RepID=UPI002DEE50EB|nr:M1 family metallopeptidase [Frateuria sp.]